MFLYKYHTEPKTLYRYDEAIKKVLPDLAGDDLLYSADIDYDMIMSNPEVAFEVAKSVFNGRFKEGEAIIATSGWYSYHYATKVLFGRFEKGEPAIKDEGHYADYMSFLEYIDKDIGEI